MTWGGASSAAGSYAGTELAQSPAGCSAGAMSMGFFDFLLGRKRSGSSPEKAIPVASIAELHQQLQRQYPGCKALRHELRPNGPTAHVAVAVRRTNGGEPVIFFDVTACLQDEGTALCPNERLWRALLRKDRPALAREGAPAVAFLVERARNNYDEFPPELFDVLRDSSVPPAEQVLRKLASDPAPRKKSGDDSNMEVILNMALLPGIYHGTMIHRAGQSGDPRAVEPLIKLLDHRRFGQSVADVRWAAIEALGAVGNEHAVDHLIPLLDVGDAQAKPKTARALERIVERHAPHLSEPCLTRLATLPHESRPERVTAEAGRSDEHDYWVEWGVDVGKVKELASAELRRRAGSGCGMG